MMMVNSDDNDDNLAYVEPRCEAALEFSSATASCLHYHDDDDNDDDDDQS